ncbi:DUF2125 domain-containing protein [Frigidibacter sp. MR17.14]|uniref:DUF2125 domain-containing protein n=1 Tax=Frigidibacter sp. MR17.14 TaxID=3126509 RepID=UPI003012F15A
MATPFPRSLKAMIWLIAVLAIVYSAYWFAGSRVVLWGARTGLAQLVAEGRAQPSQISLQGFPSRFDVTAQPVAVSSTSGWLEWQAPRADVFALSYRPTHLIAVLPSEQRLRLGQLWTDLRMAEARASVNLGLSRDLPLEQAIFVAKAGQIRAENLPETLTGAAPGEPITGFDEARAAIRALDAGGLRQELGLELKGLDLPPAAVKRLGDLPKRLDRLHADVTFTLDRPLDRQALVALPRPEAVQITDLSLGWGPATVAASGSLTVSPEGLLDGELNMSATKWDDILDLAVASRLLDRDIAKTYRRALDALADLTGTQDGALKVPLTIRQGFMSLGPLPLGYAPVLPPASAF